PEVVVKHRHGAARGATAVAPTRAYRRSRWAARLRGSGLLLGSLTMVTMVVLAIAGVLPRWSALVGVATCAMAFALVRWSVARRRATLRRGRSRAARPASTHASGGPSSSRTP